MKWYSDHIDNRENQKSIYKALVITLVGNVVLALMKLLAASYADSSALMADAYNSISDVLYSITLVAGILLAMRPADLSHPQGHGRFEPMVGLVISFSMAWAGFQALHGAVDKIASGSAVTEIGISSIALLFSALIKAAMFFSIKRIANQISSPTLKTTATDNLSDTLTSLTAILGIFLSRWISPIADPIAGIIVSIWIFRAAYLALHENLGFLTGAGTSQEELEEMRSQIAAVPGVLNVHQLFAEFVGTKLLLDVHINVSGTKTLNEVHAIESQIEDILMARKDVERIYVHTEPPEFH